MSSGGWAYFPGNKKELDEVIERLAAELRYQYIIGFTPMNAAQNGGWNKIKIKVTPTVISSKGLVARSREGYFSPTP
jgi:Ca-activated chloride channel family protein